MPSLSSDARFFGLDLRDLLRQLREPWEGASAWPVFSWLVPVTSVWLLQADGRDALWQDGQREYAAPSAQLSQTSAFAAIEVPEDLLLRRSFRLPAMGAADQHSALALEARTASPFAPDDLVWGAAPQAGSRQAASIVLASRRQLQTYQDQIASRLPAGTTPEFWAFDANGHPVVIAGFGESHRLAFIARYRRNGLTLLCSAAVIAVLIALTPALQLKLRVGQASEAYDLLTQSAAPAIARREALVRAADQTTALQQRLADRIEPLRLLDLLTRILPDDTALQSLKLAGTKATISGLTENASTLMQLLGAQPGLRDVRAPSAATRMAGSDKESFTIEFSADPAQYGVKVVAADSGLLTPITSQTSVAPPSEPGLPTTVPSASSLAVPVPATATAPIAPTAAPVSTAPSAPAVSGGGATFGGKATFGGTVRKPDSAPASGGKP